MTIYMACCCDTDTVPCNDPVEDCPAGRYFVVEGKANVFYSYSLIETERTEFTGGCDGTFLNCEYLSEFEESKSHRLFSSVAFKAIMETQNGFPGQGASPSLSVASGYLLIQKANAVTQAQGERKSLFQYADCNSANNWFLSDQSRSFNQNTDGRETAELQSFELRADIQYAECGNSSFHKPCTADLPSGCYEVWNLNATFRQFGIESKFASRDFEQENKDDLFGGGTTTTTFRDYDVQCSIAQDDTDQTPKTTRMQLFTIAPVGQDESACFLQQRREPIALFDKQIQWENPHCWDPQQQNCDDTTEPGCMNWGDHLGANSFYVEGDGEVAFLQDVGVVSYSSTEMYDLYCGRGTPCEPFGSPPADRIGCVQWYLPSYQNLVATLPECSVYWGNGSYKSISTSGSNSIEQTECGEAQSDECLRGNGANGSQCPQTQGNPDPGPFRFPERTSDWSGQAGAGFTITRFEELPELPDPSEWVNV